MPRSRRSITSPRTSPRTSPLFPHAEAPLEEAQRTKYRSLASRLRLQAGHRLLEIGCGWGGFAEFAATEIGARITAITVSDQQHAFAAERIQKAGLSDKVEIRLQDYRDVGERFDRIASIEMFEAVGERYWPAYFGKIRDCLKPDGLAGLQIITIADPYFDAYRRGVDFIQRYVFPGGMLPTKSIIKAQAQQARLRLSAVESFGESYALTLRDWRRRFLDAWPAVAALGFPPEFKRMWEYYLCYCEAGFRTGAIDVGLYRLEA
jgi:cyclopropane-fatty-acyl-phospholipid synthase